MDKPYVAFTRFSPLPPAPSTGSDDGNVYSYPTAYLLWNRKPCYNLSILEER